MSLPPLATARGVFRRAVLASILATAGAGCAAETPGDNGDGTAPGDGEAVRALFELSDPPMRFGAIPWPENLYLDAGQIQTGELPRELHGNAVIRSLREGLRDLDGFGAVSPVYFHFDGSLDVKTLPDSAEASLGAKASVFLMNFETGSPDAFNRVPIEVHWHEPERRLALRPARGYPLRPGYKYAAVVTDRVKGANGLSVEAADAFAAIRDADAAPDGDNEAAAYAQYAPIVSALDSRGIDREDVVALAVFRVQSLTGELAEAREIVWTAEEAALAIDEVYSGSDLGSVLGQSLSDFAGLDAEAGVPRANIGWMINGTYLSPSFLSRTANTRGRFERNEAGALQLKRWDTVPLSLWLPAVGSGQTLRNTPIILFQHGLGGERSDALGVANELAGSGYAVLAIDAPFHGLRVEAAEADSASRFTDSQQPDNFGDVRGQPVAEDYWGLGEGEGKLADFNGDGIADYLHPFYWREATRQGVVDLMCIVRLLQDGEVVRALQEGEWRTEGQPDAAWEDLSFDAERIGFVGVDLGGHMGVMLAWFEPAVGAAVLALTGGNVAEAMVASPSHIAVFSRFVELIGRDADELDYAGHHPTWWPEFALWQTLVEGGDALAYAPLLRRASTDVLLWMVPDDEVVNNMTTESLGLALGAVFASEAGGHPRYVDLESAELPVGGSFSVGDATATRVLYGFEEGTHDLLYAQSGTVSWKHPVTAPFERQPERTVDNPIEAARRQLVGFFNSWREGAATVTGGQ